MNRGLLIAFVLSLVLNVFAVGFMSGRLIAENEPNDIQPIEVRSFDNPFRLMRYAEALPPESRQAFRDAFREALPELRAQNNEVRALRRELMALMRAEDGDREAAAAKMTEIEASHMRQRAVFMGVFLDAFAALPAEDRRALTEIAGEAPERRELFRDHPPPLPGD